MSIIGGPGGAEHPGVVAEHPPSSAPLRSDKRRHRLPWQLTFIGLGLLIALAGVAIAAFFTYENIYSPGAFVSNYARMLADGHTAEALQVPGVAPDSEPGANDASDVLLRSAAIANLSEIKVLSQQQRDDDTYLVTLGYRVGGENFSTDFSVVQQGQLGVAPVWAFASSPLAVLDLTLLGSLRFNVNNFELDARQLVSDPAAYAPGDPLKMLVFTPGAYALSVKTPISTADSRFVYANVPGEVLSQELVAVPSEELKEQVQDSLNSFLDSCAAQPVLQPSACPFGFHIRNRVETSPSWEIVEYPELVLDEDQGYWKIRTSPASAKLSVQIRMLQDGTLVDFEETVPFVVSGRVVLGPDGNPVVRISGQGQDLD